MYTLLLASTPAPSPSPPLTVNENAVTPGVVGFLAILLVTLATIALVVDMLRRIRRVRYRGELAARRAEAKPPQP